MWVVWFAMLHHKAFDFSRGLFTSCAILRDKSREKPMVATLEELAAVLEQAPIGVLVLKQGRIAWVNARLAELIDQPQTECLGKRLAETPLAEWRNDPLAIDTKSGRRWLKVSRLEPLVGGEAFYFEDCTEQVELKQTVSALGERLKALEITDPVTGLKNRRAILKELDRQISRSRRYQNPLALIRLSLEANAAPERRQELMRAFSQTLRDKLRWADEIGVLDPCTFLVVLPETSLEDAKELVVKLLSDRIAFQLQDNEGKLRYGVAAWQTGDDLNKLLKRVEQDQEIDLSALLS
jgi:GGDEF domain-containing protein